MIANTLNNQLIFNEEMPFVRVSSIISFLVHILIIGVAMFGLPKFGRELPPDLTVINFELLKVVEETNLDTLEELEDKKTPKNEEKVLKKDTVEPKKEVITTKKQTPVEKSSISLPPEKPLIPISPSKKPSLPVTPTEKPKIVSESETPVQKPEKKNKLSNIQKPIMKPQIIKEKKKSITNPNALTSVLKTLEKIKEDQKKQKFEEIEKAKKEKFEEQKREDEFNSIKSVVKNAMSSKPKNYIKPTGVSLRDILNDRMLRYWVIPSGGKKPDELIVDIKVKLNRAGYIVKMNWVNQGLNANNTFFIIAANNAMRGLQDAEKQEGPLSIPEGLFKEWENNVYRFNPARLLNIDKF